VTGNTPAFGATNDFVQSILFRIWDGGLGDTVVPITVSGTITFNGPVTILGVITDLDFTSTTLNASDIKFHDPALNPKSPDVAHRDAVADILNNPLSRGLETSGVVKDTVSVSGNTITFSLAGQAGADDFRVILDYGNGLSDFPAGVSFDVKLNATSELGVQIGGSDFGEAIEVKTIPLTSNTIATAISPLKLPDNVYFAHTRARDVDSNFGGDDDNNGEYYVVADPTQFTPDLSGKRKFYLYILDAEFFKRHRPSSPYRRTYLVLRRRYSQKFREGVLPWGDLSL
jgi:hypothetical protein